jgi:glyoxylase-like metal-dependent hydrolase (beta-lactamase superfamily II)
MPDRLALVRAALLAFGLVAAGASAAADAGASPAAPAVTLAPGVVLVPGRFVAGTQPDGNSVLFDAPDGMIVFDTGRHATHVQAILDAARARRRPVAAIVNSHWHLDHVGGNLRLRAAFPRLEVYASGAIEEAMHGFLARYRGQLVAALASGTDPAAQAGLREELALVDAGPRLYPDRRVRSAGTRAVAGRRVEFGFERDAVTAGDLWLLDPSSGVLAAGDLVTLPAPLFDTACPVRWQAALARLAQVRWRVLVPGHGAPMRRAQFDAWRRAYDGLLACAAGQAPATSCSDGWMRDADALIPAQDRALARTLVGYYLEHRLRADPATQAASCGG